MPFVPDNGNVIPMPQAQPKAPDPTYLMMAAAMMHEMGRLVQTPFEERAAPTKAAIAEGVFDQQGAFQTKFEKK